MQALVNSFEFEGLLCYGKKSEKHSYYYVPLHADLERDNRGHPMFNLTAVGSVAYLMLTGVWRATDERLERLRYEIARKDEISEPETISLSFAPVDTVRCDLLIGDGAEQFQVLATSSTSGIPPYSALFNVTLNQVQFTQAAAALQGRSGYLVIEYDASVITPVTASGRLISVSDRFVPWLREFSATGPAGLRAAIEEAVEDGMAVVQLSPPEDPTGNLVAKLYDRILTHASDMLPQLLATWDEDAHTDFEVAATVVEDVRQQLRPSADLSKLNLTPERIIFVGERTMFLERTAETAPKMAHPLRVKLGFEHEGTPLAWVRLQRGESEAVLRSPHFAPVEVPAGIRSQPLRVTTGYSDGTYIHKKVIRLSNEAEFLLKPHHLGLTKLSLDAQPLAQAEAYSAQIWLRYRPPHRSDQLRKSFQFGNGAWTAHWWLVTLDVSSLRYLNYRWTATMPDGNTISQAVEQVGSSNIILSFLGGTTDVTDR